MNASINVVTHYKVTERFVFRFDDANRSQILKEVAHLAANPQIDFTWFDAALVSNKIRKGHYECCSSTSILKQSQRLT